MVVRKYGRNHNTRLSNAMEDYRIMAEQGEIIWKIYDGPIPGTNENAPGWVPAMWGASCLPWDLWASLDDMKPEDAFHAIRGNLRYLRAQENIIKFKPDPNLHVMKAPPPDARPKTGRLILAPQAQRERLGEVKRGETRKEPETTIGGRVRNVRNELKGRSLDEIMFPIDGHIWFGDMLQHPSGTEIFSTESQDPLLTIAKEGMAVNVESTIFAHEPSGIRFKTKQSNPLAEVLPSTSAIPVDDYIPYLGEIMTLISLARSVMELLKKTDAKEGTKFVSRTDRITEVVDFQTMQSWYTTEEDI